MTSTGTAPMTPEQARAQAALVLTNRLVTNRGLTRADAVTAVVQRKHDETGPHTDLVTAEAIAVLDEAFAPIRAFTAALVPAAEAACTAIRELMEALQATPSRPAKADRPAWVTPYGPPPRRTR
ncbi:hypothetical protein ACFWVB_02560 [Streptomyces microflavus]|uniref:hypothetical protein n=1 Tax=Streptomyces microflavus TaxID=1919 RepID=UPI003669B275